MRFPALLSREEHEQVTLAARLKHITVREYIRRAINASLRREGVDAVLLKDSRDE